MVAKGSRDRRSNFSSKSFPSKTKRQQRRSSIPQDEKKVVYFFFMRTDQWRTESKFSVWSRKWPNRWASAVSVLEMKIEMLKEIQKIWFIVQNAAIQVENKREKETYREWMNRSKTFSLSTNFRSSVLFEIFSKTRKKNSNNSLAMSRL